MHRGTAALAATAASAAALAAPSAALAVTGSANQQCYSHVPTQGSEPIVVTLSGGTPGADFIVSATVPGGPGVGSAGSADGTYDAAGNGQASITDVSPPSGTINPTKGQTVQLSVESFPPGAPSFTTPLGNVLITNLTVNVASKPLRATKPRWVSVSGTPFANKRLYGFVVKGKSRHVLKRVKLGKGNVCGFTRRKVSLAPRHYHFGRYRLYVNAGRKLNRSHALRYDFRIFRTSF